MSVASSFLAQLDCTQATVNKLLQISPVEAVPSLEKNGYRKK